MEPVTTKAALQYEKDGLLLGIEKAKKNVQIFEDAIAKERRTIEEYEEMIKIIDLHQRHG